MSETQAEVWKRQLQELDKATPDLKSTIREFLRILDSREVSDSGREFSPTYISSCRVWHSAQLEILLPKMKKFSAEHSS